MLGTHAQPQRLGPLLMAMLLSPVLGCTGAVSDLGANPPPGGGGAGGGGGRGSDTGGNGGGTAGGGGDTVVASCAASNGLLNAGVTPARRLTRDQFNNTVGDLLGATGDPAAGLGEDERIGPFDSNAIAQVDEGLVVQHQEVAAALALSARARMTTISPCDLAADTTTGCATRFVTEFGRKAYRRPLETAEIQKYVTLYSLGRQVDAQNGFRLVIEAMLQSPFFLYHHDVGTTGAPQPGTVDLTGYELASRLSYFLWNSMPDDALFTLAANGSLTSDAMLTAQTQRLLTSDRAAPTIALFHRQWLDVGGLTDPTVVARDSTKFTSQLATSMLQELALFSDHVVRSGDGLLTTLLTSNMAFPQGGLFGVYGITQPAGFTAGSSVMLPANQRAGILTQAAFLTRWAHNNQTAPVQRGKLVRLNLMCGFIDPPPPGVDTTPPRPSTGTSTRERFAAHSAGPCATCHKLMDPIGLGFESYDETGTFRTTDGPGPVVATGEIVAAGADLAGTFDGAIQLSSKLAQSQEVQNCVANQWFRFSLGRIETGNDACSIQGIRENFRSSGGNVRKLLSDIIMSPAFRHVRVNGG